jgi:hypothetical protein
MAQAAVAIHQAQRVRPAARARREPALSCRGAAVRRRSPAAPAAPAARSGSRSRCRSRAPGPASRGFVAAWPRQQRQHARHHRGLGDRLPVADRQAGVLVGLGGQRGVDETVARHARQGLQHRLVTRRRRHAGAAPCAAHRGRVQPRPDGGVADRAASAGLGASGRCGRTAIAGAAGLGHHRPGPAPGEARALRGECHRSCSRPLRRAAAQARSRAWSVRSTCSGVIDTRPLAVAWKSVPSPASRASPAGPIQ